MAAHLALALGYEDLNDHEQLRADPLFGLLSGKRNLAEPLAGKSTLNRLELVGRTGRYHKIGYSPEAIDRLLPRGVDGPVRDQPFRLRLRPGAQPAPREDHRRPDAGGAQAGPTRRQGGTCLRRVPVPDEKSWSRARRVVAKAEVLDKGQNPRFIVTSLSADEWAAEPLYEKFYCARGEMENRIKEQMWLFADRLSLDEMPGNQLSLYFSALAYTLVEALPGPWSASSTCSPWTASSTPSSRGSTWNGKSHPPRFYTSGLTSLDHTNR